MVSVGNANFKVSPFSPGGDIELWVECLEDYILAEFGTVPENRKLAIIKTAIGEDCKLAIRNFAANEKDTSAHLVEKLKTYYNPRINDFIHRNAFHNMSQEDKEPLDDYVNRLRTQATKCHFRVLCTPAAGEDAAVYHDITEEYVRDRLIIGLADKNTKVRLMRQRTLTLDGAIEMVRAAESAQNNYSRIAPTVAINNNVHANRMRKSHIPQGTSANENVRSQHPYCRYCGLHHGRGANNCEAYKKKCRCCGKANHHERVCRQKKNQRQVHDVTEDSDQQRVESGYNNEEYLPEYGYPPQEYGYDYQYDNGLDIGLLTVGQQSNQNIQEIACVGKDWFEIVLLNQNKLHTVKVDTGAQANVMSRSTLDTLLPGTTILPTGVSLSAYGGTKLPVIGKVKVLCSTVANKVCKTDVEFIIVDLKVRTVLGLEACINLHYVNPSAKKIVKWNNNLPNKQGETQNLVPNVDEIQNNPPNRCNVDESNTNFRKSTSRSTEENNPTLDNILANNNDVFNTNAVGCIKGYKYDIKLKPGSIPTISGSRPVPFATRPAIEKELRRMESLGIITKVEEPTEWVNTMVTVQKGEKTRICLDPLPLNKCIMREHLHLPTQDEVLGKINSSTIFTKIDLKDGYWQVPLTFQASMKTTFHTHLGRYRYTRLPFGLNSANEVFQKRVSQVYDGLEGVIVTFDDILIYSRNPEEHYRMLTKVFERTREYGVKLNRQKCKFMLDAVTYLGHTISRFGIMPDPEKIADIQQMPRPEDKKGIQRLLGTLNFLSRYIPNLSTLTHPIRSLLEKHVPFTWTVTHDTAFDNIKQVLSSKPVLGFYDVNKPITLAADASCHGLGACILQDGRPIAYASRALTNTQLHYAQIEKELLAIVFGCERFRQYLFAKEVEVHTDHKPLINTLNKPLHANPKRIQRLLLRLQCYNLTLVYIPGKDMHIPDMLSRAHAVDNRQTESEQKLTEEADFQVHVVIQNYKCSDEMRSRIVEETSREPGLVQVREYILRGWPNSLKDCVESAKLFWPHRAELVSFDRLILFRERMVIPKALRAEVLQRLHIGHQGQERCKRLARTAIFWPSLNKDIDIMCNRCETCLERRNKPAREPLKPHPVPDRAWQKIGIDLFSFAGRRYQIVVDYFSKWIEIKTSTHQCRKYTCNCTFDRTI